MDHHHHHHHHHPRYVLHHLPPPPPAPSVSREPSFYIPRPPPPPPLQLLPPSAAAPPLPSQLPYRPLLLPSLQPLHESHQSQFIFSGSGQRPLDSHQIRPLYHPQHNHLDFPRSQRVPPPTVRPLFDDSGDRHRALLNFEYTRNELRDQQPSRAPSSCNGVNYIRKEESSHTYAHRSVSPYRPETASIRFREDYSNSSGFDYDDYRNGNQVRSNSNGSLRSFGDNNGNFTVNLGNYEVQGGSVSDELLRDARGDGLNGNCRFGGHNWQLEPAIETVRSKENHHRDGFWLDSGKWVSNFSDSGKCTSRENRDSNGESVRTPKKKPQKKSALLRLQKSGSRNKNEQSSVSFDGIQYSSCGGQNHLMDSGDQVEETREGSPVELDVSFRKNVLVAKAIVAPSSSSVVPNKKETPRSRTIIQISGPTSNHSNLLVNKHRICTLKPKVLTDVAHNQSGSDKELNLSREKVEGSGLESLHVSDTPLYSHEENVLAKESVHYPEDAAIMNKGVGFDSRSLRKSRKCVAVGAPSPCMDASQATKKRGLEKSENFSCSPSAEERSSAGAVHLSANVVMKSDDSSQNLVAISNRDAASLIMATDKCYSNVDRKRSCHGEVERMPSPSCLLGSSNLREIQADEILDLPIPNSDNASTKSNDSNTSCSKNLSISRKGCLNEAQISVRYGVLEDMKTVSSSENVGAPSNSPANAGSFSHSRGTVSHSDRDGSYLRNDLPGCMAAGTGGIGELPCSDGIVSCEVSSVHKSVGQNNVLENSTYEDFYKDLAPESEKKSEVINSRNNSLNSDCNLAEKGSNISSHPSSVDRFDPNVGVVTSREGLKGSISSEDDVNFLKGTSLKCKVDEVLSGDLLCDINEGGLKAGLLRNGKPESFKLDEGLIRQEDIYCTLCSTSSSLPHEGLNSCIQVTSSESLGLIRDGLDHISYSKFNGPCRCLSPLQEQSVLNSQSNLLALVADQKDTATWVTATSKDVDFEKAHDIPLSEFVQHKSSLEPQVPGLQQKLPMIDTDCSNLAFNKNLPREPDFVPPQAPAYGTSNTDHVGLIDSARDALPETESPEYMYLKTDLHVTDSDHGLSENSDYGDVSNERKVVHNNVISCESKSPGRSSLSQNSMYISTSAHASGSNCLSPVNNVPLQSEGQKTISISQKLKSEKVYEQKRNLSPKVPAVCPGYQPYVFNRSKNFSSNSLKAPRTWHRTGNPLMSSQPEKESSGTLSSSTLLPSKTPRTQSTYIRKGNSLIRKSSSVTHVSQDPNTLCSSVYQLNPSSMPKMKNSVSDKRVGVMDPPKSSGIGGMNAPSRRHTTQLSINASTALGENVSCPQATLHLDDLAGNMSHSSKLSENEVALDSSKPPLISQNQIDLTVDCKSRTPENEGYIKNTKIKDLIYVKRKSNQLVAASTPSDVVVQIAEKALTDVDKVSGNVDTTHALSSDGYYRRNNNQLIRTPLENHVEPTVPVPCESSNSEDQKVPKENSRKNLNRRHAEYGVKKYKSSKFSLVWKLGDKRSPRKVSFPSQFKVLPHLFPWKRATYWRRSLHPSVCSSNSLSMIGKKLLLTRKRGTVYTRSSHGFSLRKSKVLSVGGSNLKWSKSIENRSKKANEEATIAVAEVEKRRRQQSEAGCSTSDASKNHLSRKSVPNRGLSAGERVFHIGSDQHKMGSSGRTLQMIADDEPCTRHTQSENSIKKSYVPRRLLIGNDEYVRIGNGNKLIRDPKKRTHILASEKVRWSLHTARHRLAKKQKYCQFYTRFGKCNKDNGKCPYIHDPSKIAVCSKFLNGSCSNLNCKLTHQIIPERMQDCSYFLQGLCSNEKCPYRHVNVNPSASICEGFLKGYCADGDECRKKHSYVCPEYEATGVCPQESKCKLHHPKKKNRGKKRRRPEGKNTQGRYFGSTRMDIAKPEAAMSKRLCVEGDDDIFCRDGRYVDFISLSVSDEDGVAYDPVHDKLTLCNDDPSSSL